METGFFEVPPHLHECLLRSRRQRQPAFVQQAIDVVGPEADAFHVEGLDGTRERFALVKELGTGIAGWLLLNEADQFSNPRDGGLSGICDSRHGVLKNEFNQLSREHQWLSIRDVGGSNLPT